MNRSCSLILSLVVSAISADAFAADGVSVKFNNKSSLTITNLYLSPANVEEWGPDQLGDGENDTINPGASFTLTSIKPSVYDIKLVDEDGDDCIAGDIKIKENEAVTLTDELLVGCQVASAEAELEDEAEEG
jgi:hypothetical protein